VRDNFGKTRSNIQEQANRCVKYFKEIMNIPAPLVPPNNKATTENVANQL
jgi:hypothetical protein